MAVLIGVGNGTSVATLAPVLLGSGPRTHLARIQSLLSLVQSAALLVTNNVLGAVAHAASTSSALLCCAAALGGCVATALATPTLRTLERSPINSARPAPAGDRVAPDEERNT